MKKVRRMMSKEIQRNNSFAAFSPKESGSVKSRSRTKSADTYVFGTAKNQTSILKENADKLGQLAQVHTSHTFKIMQRTKLV